jgi:DNA helicase IV
MVQVFLFVTQISMKQEEKQTTLALAKNVLSKVRKYMEQAMHELIIQNAEKKKRLPLANEDNKIVEQKLLEHGDTRVREIEALLPSPYFVRCIVQFENGSKEELAFAKFSFSDQQIYSWITPASSLRFANPGKVSYTRPDGTKRHGTLIQKDQFLIANGGISYLSTESIGKERELVYQAYFSQQKKGFALPEIVAKMEEAQDAVIRANHRGPFVISGPAGSGKTTLALHRVAYLAQSPDVSDLFKPNSILVFVQDESTRDYFSHLLPELGINGVTITTFASWAMNVLGLDGYTYAYRFGTAEGDKDMFELTKLQALSNIPKISTDTNIYKTLKQVYTIEQQEMQNMFEAQTKARVLDRFDLTVLLALFKSTHGEFTSMQEYYQMNKQHAAKKKTGRFPITYSLIIFDEFQNYLPLQIRLAKSTLDTTTNAVMYIGDMAQQTQLGTIKEWSEASEQVSENRTVALSKVYRNTRQILEYIGALGYSVLVDEHARDGEQVLEHVCGAVNDEIAYVQALSSAAKGTIGVLSLDPTYLDPFKVAISSGNVRMLSMHEAQGVEFEVVCIVGVRKDMFATDYSDEYAQFISEKKNVNKDVLYVALTRAMHELHVVGSCTLGECI